MRRTGSQLHLKIQIEKDFQKYFLIPLIEVCGIFLNFYLAYIKISSWHYKWQLPTKICIFIKKKDHRSMLNLFSALLISAKEHKKNGVSQISGVSWWPSKGKEWFTRRNEREWRSHTLREKSAYLDDYVFDRIPESCDTWHFYLSRFKKTNNQPKDGKREALTYWHT